MHRRHPSSTPFCCIVGLAAVAAAVVFGAHLPAAGAVETTTQQLFEQGEFREARQSAFAHDDAVSLCVRARLAVWDGDDEDARRFADTGIEVATDDGQRRYCRVQQARLNWLYGQRDEAIEALRELLQQDTHDLQVRFELGRMLIGDGRKQEGQSVLEHTVRRWRDDHFEQADELVWVGRTLARLQRPRDANRAFGEALRQNRAHVEANLHLGELLLDWHNIPEAHQAFERVVRRRPDHPDALLAVARIELYHSGRFAESMRLVDRVRDNFPGHPGLQRTRAELLIAQGRWQKGRRVARELVERAPTDARALALVGAAAKLQGDDEEFDRVTDTYRHRHPQGAELWTVAGEFAAMNNRHRQAVQLFENALEHNDEHRRALTGLAQALTRTGEETRGVQMLRTARDRDPFDVAVHNMLQLYERGLDDYLTDEVPEGFRLRAEADRFELIQKLAEPVVAEANEVFEDRYGVELPSLTVEVFDDSEAFAVRSVGMPHVDPHGICFGRVVLVRGPGAAEVNWPLVLWHELAHAYHLELSDERVPTWFTEGLAEYETRLHNDSWTRFHDLSVARMLEGDEMWSVAELDEVFMTAPGPRLAVAYQVARLFMAFVDDEYGMDTIVEMLEGFADEPHLETVFEQVLGASVEGLDAEFEQWLRGRYAGLLDQHLVDWSQIRALEADRETDEPAHSAYRAMAAALRGDEQQARLYLADAHREDDNDPEVAVLTVLVHQALGDVQAGLEAGQEALNARVEGYDLRYSLAHLAREADDDEAAYVHAVAATELAPTETDAWRLLESAAAAIDHEVAEHRARRRRFEFDPHNEVLARDQTGLFEDHGVYDEAYRAANRWSRIAATDARAHLAVARVAVQLQRFDAAADGFDRAASASPGRRDDIWQTAVDKFERAGAEDFARDYRRRLEDTDQN